VVYVIRAPQVLLVILIMLFGPEDGAVPHERRAVRVLSYGSRWRGLRGTLPTGAQVLTKRNREPGPRIGRATIIAMSATARVHRLCGARRRVPL
jgi:hypothetical protein